MKADELAISDNGVDLKYYCRSAWEAGVNREKIRTYDIIEFLKKELMHKASFKNVLKRENRQLKDKLKGIKKRKNHAQQIQWHDSDDLPPKEKGQYSIDVLTDTEEIAYYDYDSEEWIRVTSNTVIETPNAWCALPKCER